MKYLMAQAGQGFEFAFRPAFGPSQSPLKWTPGTFLGDKAPGYGIKHPLPTPHPSKCRGEEWISLCSTCVVWLAPYAEISTILEVPTQTPYDIKTRFSKLLHTFSIVQVDYVSFPINILKPSGFFTYHQV